MLPKETTREIADALRGGDLLRFGTRIGVAVSGGADSIFLLHAMADLGYAAAVLHVNHGLRGAASDEDEAMVREVAASFALPILVRRANLPAGNSEQEGRLARYSYFGEILRDGTIDAVATGHTRDDQAETVLYRFLRGSGTAGLSGIRPVTDTRLIRPMLGVSRERIRRELADCNIHWREDCSNSDVAFARNRIRLEIMPALAFANPALTQTLAATAEWAQAEESYWRDEVERAAENCVQMASDALILNRARMQDLPVAMQRRILRHAVERVRGDLRSVDFSHIEALRSLIVGNADSGRVQIPRLDAMLSCGYLRIASLGDVPRQGRHFEVTLAVPGETHVASHGVTVCLEPVTNPNVYNNQVNAFDRNRCAGTLRLRNWLPGDQLHRQGRASADKIKTLFQEFRVPIWERRGWPVITVDRGDSESIVWARQFGVSANFAANGESTAVFQVRESKPAILASIEQERARHFVSRPTGEPGAEVM